MEVIILINLLPVPPWDNMDNHLLTHHIPTPRICLPLILIASWKTFKGYSSLVFLFLKHLTYRDQFTQDLPFRHPDAERVAAETTTPKAIAQEAVVACTNMGQNPSTCPHSVHHLRTVSYFVDFCYKPNTNWTLRVRSSQRVALDWTFWPSSSVTGHVAIRYVYASGGPG